MKSKEFLIDNFEEEQDIQWDKLSNCTDIDEILWEYPENDYQNNLISITEKIKNQENVKIIRTLFNNTTISDYKEKLVRLYNTQTINWENKYE